MQDLRGEQHPNHGKEHPRRQTERDIGVDGGTHLFHLTGTEKAGNHHARAHRNTAEEPHQQKDEGAGAGHRRQRAVAQQVADDENKKPKNMGTAKEISCLAIGPSVILISALATVRVLPSV